MNDKYRSREDNCEHIYVTVCAFTTLMDSYRGSLSYSQITELRRKVAVCFNLDLGASLQQKLSWKLSLIKSKLLCKWPEKNKNNNNNNNNNCRSERDQNYQLCSAHVSRASIPSLIRDKDSTFVSRSLMASSIKSVRHVLSRNTKESINHQS